MDYDEFIREYLRKLVVEHGLYGAVVTSTSEHGVGQVISSRIVSPKWFNLPSREYAIVRGKEYMMECSLHDFKAHVFTAKPYIGSIEIKDVVELELDRLINRSIFYCTLNVVLKYLGLVKGTIHCRGDEPVKCAREMIKKLLREHGVESPLLIIGYQPAIVREATRYFREVYVTDMDPDNIGKEINGVKILDHSYELDLIDRVEVVLVTSSSIVNSTFWDIYEASMNKYLYIYGVSGAGVSYVLNIPRLCYYSK